MSIVIKINENSRIPKYKQIVDSIVEDISKGKIKVGEKLPSINNLCENLYLSRDTVEKAYNILKKKKVIVSVQGKGTYSTQTALMSKVNVLFLINKPSTYKLMIFHSFVNEMEVNTYINLSIYHSEESIFIRSLEKNMGFYDYYIIMPHFKDENLNYISFTEKVLEVIECIPKDKLIILDNTEPHISGNYGSIYQDYENDIFNALTEALDKLRKYDKLVLIYPSKAVYPYPKGILRGFRKFCTHYQINFEVLNEIYENMELQRKNLYITIQELDLVNLVLQALKRNLQLGKDIGIISYNETPLKELLGISVISTNFQVMGETAANMVLKNKKEKVKNVFKYIERNSV